MFDPASGTGNDYESETTLRASQREWDKERGLLVFILKVAILLLKINLKTWLSICEH